MRSQLLSPVMAVALVACIGAAAGAKPKDPQEPVVVESLTHAGNGCPAGSVSHIISPDSQAVSALFDQFVVEVGPGVPFSEGRKDCTIEIVLKAPEGKSVAVLHADFRGFVQFQAGVVATFTADFQSEELDLVASLARDFVGPQDRDYHLGMGMGMDAPIKELAWSNCDGTAILRIAVALRLLNTSNPTAAGLATLDSVDGELKQGGNGKLKFKIASRHCR